MLTTILKSFDTVVTIAETSSSITLPLTGIGLKVMPISSVIACAFTISNILVCEIFIQKHNKYKKPYDKDQHTNNFFDKLYRKKNYKIM